MPKKITKTEFDKLDKENLVSIPAMILIDLLETIYSMGTTKFLHGTGHERDKTSLYAVMFAWGVRKLINKECYLRIPKNDPPDFFMATWTDRPISEKPFDYAEVELTTIPLLVDKKENYTKFVEDIVLKKTTNYSVRKDTILLIFINSVKARGILRDIEKIYSMEKKRFNNFKYVFAMHLNELNSEVWTYTLKNLTNGDCVELNMFEELRKKPIPHPYADKFGLIIKD